MDTKEFKTLFDDVAKSHGFKAAHSGWYREEPAALIVLNLQKSNLGNCFELNLKLFLGLRSPAEQADFKKLVKTLGGDIFRRQPEECRSAFEMDGPLDLTERRVVIDGMFCKLVDKIVAASADSAGILSLRDEGVIYLLPTIENRLKAG